MIPVAADHVRDVGGRPLVKQLGVTGPARLPVVAAADPFVFGRREFVERLVLHQQAQPVAQVQQFRRGRIVAGADGVDADFLQQAQSPFQHLVRHRRAEAAGLVMDADALELHRLAVEKETLVGIEPRRADAEGRGGFIQNGFAGFQPAAQRVKRRRIQRPQLRADDVDFLHHSLRRAGAGGFRRGRTRRRPGRPVARMSDCSEKDFSWSAAVFDRGFDADDALRRP